MADWHTSTHSGGNNECVEVREHAFGADLRDSKHPDAGHLPFPASEWSTFLNTALSR